MNNTQTTQRNDRIPTNQPPALTIAAQHTSCIGAISENKTDVISAVMSYPSTHTTYDAFFNEPIDIKQEARSMATEVIRHLLIWMADGRTAAERGLRASVALYCIRPDLVNGATLEQIGAQAGCTRQAVHKLACSFRCVTGLAS
jgi:hypothetical protein